MVWLWSERTPGTGACHAEFGRENGRTGWMGVGGTRNLSSPLSASKSVNWLTKLLAMILRPVKNGRGLGVLAYLAVLPRRGCDQKKN